MELTERWRQIFKGVVAREISSAGGKDSDGYKAVATRTGLGYAYIYQIYNDKPEGKPKRPSPDAMSTLRRTYTDSDDPQIIRLVQQIPSGEGRDATSSTLEEWSTHASPRSREVIDQLRLMAQKNVLGDEDWGMISQLAQRFQKSKK